MTASQIMVVGFALLILVGGILLALPVCNADGQWLNFIDALFTSCTAVCVTGLVTIVPATQFTMLGKVILLVLIQIGGLGIIVCTMSAFLILHRQITVRSRVLIQENFNLNTMTGLVSFLIYVLKGTFLVEGIGAVLYAFQFVPEYGFLRGIWYAVFHAVSAFCNAGIDLLGDSSLQMYQTNPLVNFTTIGLIIVSGLGFLVWRDLTAMAKRVLRREMAVSDSLRKMKLHTKLALSMTLILIVGGTIAFFCLEYTNPDTLGPLSLGQKWMAALFQSVTTRTAGFFMIPQNLFREPSKLISCVLMFIGGSPGGTAGGVKTVTIAVLLLTCGSVLKGNEDTECFRRKIPATSVRTGFSVFTVAFLATLIGTIVLTATEQVPLMTALYEVTSAVATVGLSEGLTPLLSAAGKLVVIVLMYMGRLSPVTLALLFAGKSAGRKNHRKLPEERIMVG
jgi:trk system potassium uptake protein TrkH